MPVSSGRRRPSFPPPCQRRPPRQCCSRCPERPFPSSSGPPSARPASFSSSAAGCWNPARPSTRPPRLCGRETPLFGTGRPPRQRPRRSPWPSCHASTRCRPRPASPRSSWRSPGRTCPSYEACPPSRPGPEAVSVRRVRTCTPPRGRPRSVARPPPPPREFTYLLLLLSLHALAVPELAPGVLDLSRRGVSQNSSFIRTNCRAIQKVAERRERTHLSGVHEVFRGHHLRQPVQEPAADQRSRIRHGAPGQLVDHTTLSLSLSLSINRGRRARRRSGAAVFSSGMRAALVDRSGTTTRPESEWIEAGMERAFMGEA